MNKTEINELLNLSYESVNSDLRFAETKNTFLVTFNSAIIGIIVAFLTSNNQISSFSRVLMIIFSFLIFFATIISVFSFVPLNKVRNILTAKCKEQKQNIMFYLYNASMFASSDKERYNAFEDEFKRNCNYNEEMSYFEKVLISQIVDLSNIAFTKFKLFTYAVYVELISAVFFAIFLIVA